MNRLLQESVPSLLPTALSGLERVEETLRSTVDSHVWLLRAAGRHVVGSGGKRLRPLVTLLAYGAAGGADPEAPVPLAAAVELLHTASLVHDDINDQSDLRRGQSTVNRLWGDHLALLAGDFIFVRLLHLIAPYGPRIVQEIADACSEVVEGETRQMLSLGDTSLTEDEYLDIVRQKTAALFSSCAVLGAMLAGAGEAVEEALREYGHCLGMAFQIRDDVLDLGGEAPALGKPVRADLRQRKMSLATIQALRCAEAVPQAGARAAVAEALFADDDAAYEMLCASGALEYASQRAEAYAARAREALEVLADGPERRALGDLAGYALQRQR